MTLALHKIKTVFRHLVKSWKDSEFIVKKSPDKNRLSAYFSLLYWFYFYGNDFNDYCTFRFWEKSTAQKKSYISLRRNDRLRFALSTTESHQLFLDKAAFNTRFAKYVKRRWMLAADASDSAIDEFIVKNRNVIAKPLTDFGGHGVMKISSDNQRLTPPDLYGTLRTGNYILEECIENAPAIKSIAPGSLNTVRIVTVIDRDGCLHILAAVLRMGNGTAITDNYHDGGMACAIDVSSGTLIGRAFGMGCVEYSRHPLSDIVFDGFHIGGFDKCLDLVKEIAFVEPSARYVGWDFAITPDGIDLLEGNIPPGEDITQIAAGHGLWYEINKLI